MNKQYLRILAATIGFCALSLAAKGQTVDQIKVNIPYQFVVNGKTLPAGTYSVRRVLDKIEGALILSNVENHTGAVVLAKRVESASGDRSEVSFDEVGGQHFLSKIKTSDYEYIIPPSRAEIIEAAAAPHSGAPAAGSSGGSSAGSN
jgi:hypothetical protein